MREVPLHRVAPDSPKQTGPRGSVFLHPPFYTARGVVSRDPPSCWGTSLIKNSAPLGPLQ